MKKSLFLLATTLTLCISCTTQDQNIPIIKKEFKKYMNKTFDDPHHFKEFVEISPIDTISIIKMQLFIDNYVDNAEKRKKELDNNDSINLLKYEEVLANLKKTGTSRKSYSVVNKFYSLTYQQADLVMEKLPISLDYITDISAIKKMRDSIPYYPALFVYDIKYRMKEFEGLKLYSKYAYLDSLNHSICFSDKLNDFDIINNDFELIVKRCYDNSKLLNSLDSIETLYSNSIDELNDLIKSEIRK